MRHQDDALTTHIELDCPIELAPTIAHGRMGSGDPCVRLVDGALWRSTRTPLGPATERFTHGPGGDIVVEAWGPGAEWLLAKAPAACGALDRPEEFRPVHPLLNQLVKKHRGLRIGRSEAVFETALFAILEQRVATREAWRNWRLFVRALGEPAPGPLHGLFVPPSPERIAATPYEVFHRFGVERRRSEIMRRVAIVARRLEETVDLALEAAYARLRAIPGIGPWTAGRIAMLALGDCDAVFIGDLHLPSLVSLSLAGERFGSDERMLELLEPYRGHRARVVRLLLAR